MRIVTLSLPDAVEQTVSALPEDAADAALIALTRAYARELDTAAIVARKAEKAYREAVKTGDAALIELVESLRAKVSERAALDRIGFRLHSALSELRATPKSRPEARGGTAGPTGTLGKLRAVKDGAP